MKKIPAIIIVILLSLIMWASLRKEPSLEDINLNDSLSDINIPELKPIENKNVKVDFESCEPGKSYKIDEGMGSAQLKIIEQRDTICLVETTYELEGGYYINECQVPVSMGTVNFDSGDFETIAKYCTIKSSGNGLLELDNNLNNR